MESTLDQIFAHLLQNSAAGALLIAVFLAVVGLLRGNIPALGATLFAGLILIRLVLPVVPEIGVKLPSLWIAASEVRESPREVVPVEAPAVSAELGQLENLVLMNFDTGEVHFTEPQFRAASSAWRLPSLAEIWLVGVLLLLGGIGYQHFQFANRVRKQSQSASPELEAQLADVCAHLGIRERVRIHLFPGGRSPVLFGMWNPMLLIPKSFEKEFSKEERQAIFLHELAHLRRGDLWWNWFACLVLCLHWFNPFVWLLVRRFRLDRETLCDRVAVNLLPGKQIYSSTLLKVVQRLAATKNRRCVPLQPGVSSIFSKKSEIKQRLIMIQNPQTCSFAKRAILFSIFCTAILFSFPASGEEGRERGAPEAKERGREVGREDRQPESRDAGNRKAPDTRGARGDGDRGHPERSVRKDGDRVVSPERRDPEPPRNQPANERQALDHQLREMHNALANTRRAGRQEEAEAIERRIREMTEHRERMNAESGRPAQAPEARLHHLHLAAENLDRAGLPGEAERYRDQARRLEEEIQRGRESREGAGRAENLEREVRELRELVGNLEQEIRRLHEQLSKRRD
ncbi:MAG: M56 family metallopeptidase [Verrucomicrobiales bacterium]|nr:M56 family metallopeptidase [Verrucomicrobiales bacterium]